jgi:hypothetical protein
MVGEGDILEGGLGDLYNRRRECWEVGGMVEVGWGVIFLKLNICWGVRVAAEELEGLCRILQVAAEGDARSMMIMTKEVSVKGGRYRVREGRRLMIWTRKETTKG